MTIIGIDPIGTTSLYSMTTATNSIVKDDNASTTTALGVATTLSASVVPSQHIDMNITSKYIDSLSDDELARFVEIIENKDISDHTYSDNISRRI